MFISPNCTPLFTARKPSLRRLCFYTCLSVILFTGGCVHGKGCVCVCKGGMHCRGHVWAGGHAWWGVCVAGGYAWWGVCMAGLCSWHGGGHAWCGGGMHGRGVHGGGYAWWGACMAGGMHATHTPRTLRDTVGQCAGGTHPTGMHSF